MFNSGSCDKDYLDRYGVDRFNIQRVNPTGRQQRAVASKFNGNEMRPTYDFNLPRLPGCIKMQSPESAWHWRRRVCTYTTQSTACETTTCKCVCEILRNATQL